MHLFLAFLGWFPFVLAFPCAEEELRHGQVFLVGQFFDVEVFLGGHAYLDAMPTGA